MGGLKKVKLGKEKRRAFRKVRSRLKVRIKNNAIIPRKIKAKYNLIGHKNLRKFKERNSIKIIFPPIFCHIKNTKATSKFLAFFQSQLLKEPNHIFLSYKETSYIGLSASYLFDKLLDGYLSKQRSENNRIIQLQGFISKNKEVNHVLFSIGHLKKISNLQENSNLYDFDFKKKIKTFEFIGSKSAIKDQDEAVQGLVRYFNECLHENGFHFTKEAESELVDSFTEIIDNADQHSGEDKWEVIGYYDSYKNECSFAIINEGKTFHETFEEKNSTAQNIISEIREGLKDNRSLLYKLFGRIDEAYYEQCISMFLSIQDGISSKRQESGKDRTRGFGIMDLLEKMSELTPEDNKAKITLISGRAAINIDFTYQIYRIEDDRYRVIYLNDKKSFKKIPDPKKVYLLKENFFGTLITGIYQINREHLKKIAG